MQHIYVNLFNPPSVYATLYVACRARNCFFFLSLSISLLSLLLHISTYTHSTYRLKPKLALTTIVLEYSANVAAVPPSRSIQQPTLTTYPLPYPFDLCPQPLVMLNVALSPGPLY